MNPPTEPTRRPHAAVLVRGIAWVSSIQWAAQLLTWASTLVIARILTPTDYGLVGMAMVYVGLVQIVTEAGLFTAVVQQRDLSDDQISLLCGLSIMLGVAAGALTLGAASLIAAVYTEPAVHAVVMVLSLVFVIRAPLIVPRGLMVRDLEFRKLAVISGLETMGLIGGTLTSALLGMGHWALVVGQLAASAAAMLLFVRARPHRIAFPRNLTAIQRAVTLGSQVGVSQVAWYLYHNADFAIVGRVLGKAALGAYTFAWNIATIPINRMAGLAGGVVGPGVFSSLQNDRAAMGRYHRVITEGLGLVMLPVSAGLALVAHEIVPLILGPGWVATVAPLRILALYVAFRSMIDLNPMILYATGHARRCMYYNLWLAALLPIAFLAGARWGTSGVALAWVLGYTTIAGSTFVRRALQVTGVTWRQYARAAWPGASATAVMIAAVLLVRHILPAAWSDQARLAAVVLVGAGAYVAAVLALHAERVRAVKPVLLEALGRRPPAPRTVFTTDPRPAAPRLLLITYHFPPDPSVGALRWRKFARHAAERGWALDVLALDPAELETRDAEALRDLPPGVRVFGVPAASLRVERLVERAWRLLHPVRTVPRRDSVGRGEVGWRVRESRDVARAYFAWLDYARMRHWARRAAQLGSRIVSPGLHRAVITSGPPHMAHEAGRLMATRTGLPLVLDFRDPWSLWQRLPEAIASPVWLHLAGHYERRAVGEAGLVVMNSESARIRMAQQYPQHRQRIIAVPNGYDPEDLVTRRASRTFIIAYAGNIYIDRDPRPLFRALARVIARRRLTPQDVRIELMGWVSTFDGVGVEELAAAEGIADHVRLYPVGPRGEALRFLAQASMLVVLPQDSDLAIPAKVFEYMQCDAWLLALAERESAVELLLRGTAADVVSPGATDEIAAVIERRYLAQRQGARAVRLASNGRFSRREQADKLFAAVEALTGPPAPPLARPTETLVCAAS